MRKPTFYCCLKHRRIKAQAIWVQVTDDFFTHLGRNERVYLVFTNCDKYEERRKDDQTRPLALLRLPPPNEALDGKKQTGPCPWSSVRSTDASPTSLHARALSCLSLMRGCEEGNMSSPSPGFVLGSAAGANSTSLPVSVIASRRRQLIWRCCKLSSAYYPRN